MLDDIGVENASQTAYNIIDEWYQTGKPLIVTTNLTPNELKQPQTRELKRIYPIVDKVESLRDSMMALKDDELRGKTKDFKDRLAITGTIPQW